MKKILIVFGTRPEAIKMAPLVKEFLKHPDDFETKVCVTAQHREMLDQVLDFFEIKPDFDLNLMKSGQDLYEVTSGVLLGLRDVFDLFEPDIVFVHGDTTTTFSASLAAFYKKIKVAHIEAGLRTGDIYSPWPEEANRKLTSQVATYHFAPTPGAKKNLLNEGVDSEKVFVTGNSVIDALRMAINKIESDDALKENIIESIKTAGYQLDKERKFILVTGHRRENFGEGFLNICQALKEVAGKNPDLDIVYPVHLNPNVQKPVFELLSDVKNIYLIKPLEYQRFVYMMNRCYFILTDSGGIQEEAPTLGKPILVMRNTTERPEALSSGCAVLVGTSRQKIVDTVQMLVSEPEKYSEMALGINPYGDGTASENVVSTILRMEVK